MKKFKVIYKDYYSNEVTELLVTAECEQDARNFFFKNKSGLLLRVEFVSWA